MDHFRKYIGRRNTTTRETIVMRGGELFHGMHLLVLVLLLLYLLPLHSKELKKTMEEEQYINQTAIQEEKEAAVLENHTVGSERKVRFALCYVKSPSRVRGPVVKSNL